jgi:hypothetical protein
MTRARLPDRRPSVTLELEHDGFRCMLSSSTYADGRLGEVFVAGLKSGSAIEALVTDAAVLVSLLLQHGITPADLAASIGRIGGHQPASLIGAVVDRLLDLDVEHQR